MVPSEAPRMAVQWKETHRIPVAHQDNGLTVSLQLRSAFNLQVPLCPKPWS